eukprot:CAMPEP_0178953282 /NCGR_PEP_ID=MMETSP0789-20121207/8330_1 /TAXON_ID=3005 /ORGANISM="Rhizosolenia setigera, Strain CCMP 1694" /LENGTH=285 /DNA_ID=CAMNT_0020634519 /DNA_START=93 /DNA_END=950 /DNA_ORIENTATION=+
MNSTIASASEPVVFPNGASTLFIGHSIYVPVSREFDTFAEKKSSLFPNHKHEEYFQGGEKGDPVYLWENHKDEVEAFLASGDIELFGMTVGLRDGVFPESDDMVEGYKPWIDLALTYNNNTSIFIGIPWPDFPTDYENAASYTSIYDTMRLEVYPNVIVPLRDIYPDVDIHFLAYGTVATKMKSMFENDELDDICRERKDVPFFGGTDENSLFRDKKGHGGTMLLNLAGLAWLHWFYGTDVEDLADEADDLGWDRDDALEVLNEVFTVNEEYRLVMDSARDNVFG